MFSCIRYFFVLNILAWAWAQNSTILDQPLQNASIPTSQRVGFVWGSNNRSTLMLLWSCMATILSCTWTVSQCHRRSQSSIMLGANTSQVLHLNCPAPDDGYWTLFLRKTKWMFITLLAPEFTFSIAAMQWFECRTATAQFRYHGHPGWTMTHSFYARMGGFVLETPDHSVIPLFPRELFDLVRSGSVQKPTLLEDDINDRSKADSAVKLFTVLQSGWFVTQCIARAAQDLPLSELEITTMAFAFVAMSTYVCWWNKPVSVNTTTHVKIVGDSLHRLLRDDLEHFIVWDFKKNRTPQRIKLWTSGLWTSGLSRTAWDHSQGPERIFIPLLGAATIFGGIHCIAWDFDFATDWERILWRSCALITTILGTITILSPLVLFRLGRFTNHIAGSSAVEAFNRPLVMFLMLGIYPLARIALMFESFYSLRSLPSRVYVTATWVNYIPHIG